MHQGEQEGEGGEAVELDALLLQRPYRGFHLFATVKELGLDRSRCEVQKLRNLLDAELVIVPHTENQVLLLGQGSENLLHQPGGLLPIQRQLRLGFHAQIGQLGELPVLVSKVCKGHRQALAHPRCGEIHGNPPQPGEKGFVVLQRVQAVVGAQIGVLLNVPCQILVAGHGANAAVEIGAGQHIQIRESVLIPGLGLFHQHRECFRSCKGCFFASFHGFLLLLVASFF